ncbi:L-serine dehydratase 1 [Aquimixticola soesokkakensis]|uniref:L-serine dehydratase n=1 Tax=Aquimixticola soesokkakensis TaxID=1519096 RepID=A0A1Y5T5A7_9RHOB|nr:L-serine ammonia-lyase [Aquimixticola soesokkakensis]SLN55766.1 L-serine dehydratase 1 [Aquimixticola soesokkakensis]
MFLSVTDVFKLGIGPSSSHTMGPMVAAARFVSQIAQGHGKYPGCGPLVRLSATLHGSLAFTGKGHATDRAVILGLCGLTPDTLDPDRADEVEADVRRDLHIPLAGFGPLRFDPAHDLVFDYGPALPRHANGMVLRGHDAQGHIYYAQTYYSVGGGFIVTEDELSRAEQGVPLRAHKEALDFPFPFGSAREMLEMGRASGKTVAQMKRANERKLHGPRLEGELERIWGAMEACINRGLARDGILPGGLNVKRRARDLHGALLAEQGLNQAAPHVINDWMSLYAMAVNEENAAGGPVVTAPTNGAAGVVPAVMRYYRDHCLPARGGDPVQKRHDFLLVAAAIGGLIKHNASISGAEVGCQGEVGSAAAMAAAGLCAVLGGTNEQVENAAEIALEHHLGMTCDPAAGLVQVPCIERNALGAIKAVSAASLALRGDGTHFMPLDNCIQVMLETGRDMSAKYKETSTGGLAVNLPEC